MPVVEELFKQYVTMRRNGMIKTEVFIAQRYHFRRMPQEDQQEFIDSVSAWEQNQATSNKALGLQPANDPKTLIVTKGPAIIDGVDWLTCKNCGNDNPFNSVFCSDCGQALDLHRVIVTKRFNDELEASAEYFGEDSLLVLTTEVNNNEYEFEIVPQEFSKGVVIGRSAIGSTINPDIDLCEIGAIHEGVSRLHLTIRFDADYNVLKAYDLGSTNGTFINEHRLHNRDVRVLCNGDTIILGRLIMRASFFHPGDGS
jgi:hypothetical protein